MISEGRITPQFEVGLTSYQRVNRYLLPDESDPQLQTALDRIYPEIAARKAAQEEEEVTPSDSASTTAKASDKTQPDSDKSESTAKEADKTTNETKATKATAKS